MSIHSLEFTTCITTILIYVPCNHEKLFIHLNVTITAEVAWHEEVAMERALSHYCLVQSVTRGISLARIYHAKVTQI